MSDRQCKGCPFGSDLHAGNALLPSTCTLPGSNHQYCQSCLGDWPIEAMKHHCMICQRQANSEAAAPIQAQQLMPVNWRKGNALRLTQHIDIPHARGFYMFYPGEIVYFADRFVDDHGVVQVYVHFWTNGTSASEAIPLCFRTPEASLERVLEEGDREILDY